MAIAGKVAPIPKGEWSASENYEKLNIVRYNNMVFMAKIDNKGVTPVDRDTWILLIQGESDIATLDLVGLVKPDGETMGVAKDGTLSVEKVSAENVYRADGSTTIESEIAKYVPSETISTMPIPSGEKTYRVNPGDATFPYPYGLLEIRGGANPSEYTATFKTTGTDENMYYCIYRNGVWSAWERLVKESELDGKLDIRNNNVYFSFGWGAFDVVLNNTTYTGVQLPYIKMMDTGSKRYWLFGVVLSGSVLGNRVLVYDSWSDKWAQLASL